MVATRDKHREVVAKHLDVGEHLAALINVNDGSAVSDMLPDSRLVEIAGAGHSPYFEDPATWNAVVEGFLASLDR